MKNLDIIISKLDTKIQELKDIFEDYRKISLSESQIAELADFEYLEIDIKLVDTNSNILETLNLYIQKRVEVVTILSLIVKDCLSHKNFLEYAKDVIEYLEEHYNEKSGFKLMYSDCYLNSTLAALNAANKHSFIEILKVIDVTTGTDIPGVPVANLQMKNALSFKILAYDSFNSNEITKFLKENGFNNIDVISTAVENAYKLDSVTTNKFLHENKEWLKVDLKNNLAIFESDDWTAIDHVNSPVKLDKEITTNLFYENLLKEYADMLKLFKNAQTSKAEFDVSTITEDFASLSNTILSQKNDSAFTSGAESKLSFNSSSVPLFINLDNIVNDNLQNSDVLKLSGNVNNEEEA